MEALQEDETIAKETELRQSKYFNNIVEQDHQNTKRIVKSMVGFQSFNSARKPLNGIEAMNIICEGQVKGTNRGDSVSQAKFVETIFGIATQGNTNDTDRLSLNSFCNATRYAHINVYGRYHFNQEQVGKKQHLREPRQPQFQP